MIVMNLQEFVEIILEIFPRMTTRLDLSKDDSSISSDTDEWD